MQACARAYACVLTRVCDITRAHLFSARITHAKTLHTRAFRAHDLIQLFGIYIFSSPCEKCAICDFFAHFSTKKRKTNIKALRQRNKFITLLHKSAFCKIFKIF